MRIKIGFRSLLLEKRGTRGKEINLLQIIIYLILFKWKDEVYFIKHKGGVLIPSSEETEVVEKIKNGDERYSRNLAQILNFTVDYLLY